MVLDAALIGGGSLLSGLAGAFGDPIGDQLFFERNRQAILPNPNDPVNSALAFDALMLLGNFNGAEEILRQQSPLAQFKARVNAIPQLTLKQKEDAIRKAERLASGLERGDNRFNVVNDEDSAFERALQLGGIPRQFVDQLNPEGTRAYEERIQQQLADAQSAGVGDARTSALRQLSQNVLAGESGSPGGLREVALNELRRTRDDEAERLTADVLARANAGGFNPAGLLAEIEKERLRQASASPLLANQVADQEFDRLMQFLAFGSGEARQSAAVNNQAALGAAGIAANQLQAAGSVRGGNSTGAAVGGVGDTLTTIGLLGQLNRSRGPATDPTPRLSFDSGTNEGLINQSFARSFRLT